ncbi:MAG: response regulator [Chlorobi bacterium]|nr:response regulator [Chlorobiota bacterium]
MIKLLSVDNDLNNENTYKLLLNNITHALALVLILIFGVLALINEQYIHSTILFISSLLVISNYYFLNRTKKLVISTYIIVTIVSFLLIYLFASGLNGGNGTLWFYIYPPMCLFLLGLNTGSIYFVVVLAFTLFVFYFPNIEYFPQEYTNAFKIRFLLSFVTVYVISYIYEYLRAKTKLELEKSILEAEGLNKSKTEFITRLSHQLRTPLNSIIGLSSLLKNTGLNKNQSEYIETIDTSANNLMSTIKEIVEVTKLDSELDKLKDLSFDLHETVKNAMFLFQKKNEDQEIKFNLSYSKFIPNKLVGSPLKVKQVIHNIIETCLKSSDKKSFIFDVYVNNKKETDIALEILFEIHTSSIELPIEITNQQYENDKLFQYFNEKNIVLNEKEKESLSSGTIKTFNLSVAEKIVELYGGRIGVSRKETGIVVFWFTMLFWKTKKENILTEEKRNTDKSEHGKTGAIVKKKLRNANVLIVEDNLINQKVLYLGLKETVNSIDMAHNGKEAIDMFSKSKYDIVLLDIQMPIMDGYKTTRKLRELESANNVHTPIIAMTANAMEGDKEKCLNEGMDEYISKPYQMDYLVKCMEFHLSDSPK